MRKIKRVLLIVALLGVWPEISFPAETKTSEPAKVTAASKNITPEVESIVKKSKAKMAIDNSGAYLSDFSTAELIDMFRYLEYDEYIKVPGNVYPRIFVKNIPYDFAAFENQTERNRLFIQILMPLVLKVNNEILEERAYLDAVAYSFEQNHDFGEAETYYLELLAEKYDVTTPFKDTRRHMKLLKELMRRVDIVPPSILIAAAAVYTNWGTSRIAVQGNNLYKARDWYTNEGLKPIGEDDDSYRYHIYPSLEDSVRAYILRINSHIKYQQFWNSRKESRRRGSIVYGKRMDWTFVLDNNLRNYAGLLDYTLTYYKFFFLDEATLEEEYEFED